MVPHPGPVNPHPAFPGHAIVANRHGAEAVVVPGGRLGTNLLGMSFLKRVRDFSIAGGTMTLRG